MLEVRGFRAFRFNERVCGPLDEVVTPPFDVISPKERAELAARSPYNMMHVLLPEPADGMDPYQAAAKRLEAWLSERALVQDPSDSFYLLEQRFTGLDGEEHVRRGFFARTKLPESADDDDVLDHERTFASKVADRMALTEAAEANLGAVFVLYHDEEDGLGWFLKQMDDRAPEIEAKTADGVLQRVWRVEADDRVTAFFKDRTLYIADGHHRFRTAREYRDKRRAEDPKPGPAPYDYVLMGFVALSDPGLYVWPTHRLLDPPESFDEAQAVEALKEHFDVKDAKGHLAEEVEKGPGCTFGMAVSGGGQYVLHLRDDVDRKAWLGPEHSDEWLALDVTVLHRGVLEEVLGMPEGMEFVYEPMPDKALEMVESGEKGLAFLVKATPTAQVVACAEAHDPMPEKATYFFPKLPSGAVIHRLA